MYIVREIFRAKPGNAGKMAKLMKKAFKSDKSARVMTDMVGPYHTVVIETEVESLAAWEQTMKDYKAGKPDPNMDEEVMKEMANYNDWYVEGRREIYQIIE
ncbi:MAG: hypothetical protein KW788_01240 [Candidatus Doudnabacteria bacterium]|nr:hypothetical protein [Candidatus Doudnabacteria bacterium]